jgi:hypothetical protein
MKNANSGYNKNTKSNDGPKHNVYPGPDESIKHNMGIGHMENSGHNANLDYVIIGNSAAGVAAAESIRKIDKKGKIKRKVSLYLAILKKENFELAVQKSVESGISEIIPVITERTIKTGLNTERLKKIILEANFSGIK